MTCQKFLTLVINIHMKTNLLTKLLNTPLNILCLLLIYSSASLAQSGNFLWAKKMGGNMYDRGTSIAYDPSGNIYNGGYFLDTADFDPGPGTYNLIASVPGNIVAYITKLDPYGNLIWAKCFRDTSLGGTSQVQLSKILFDREENVYLEGGFIGTIDFDPGPGVHDITATLYKNAFIVKLDSEGNFLWAKSYPGEWFLYYNYFPATVNNSESIYVAGNDPSAFISKIDLLGNVLWTKKFTGNVTPTDIKPGINNDIYIAGFFDGTVDVDPDTTIHHLTAASGDAFVIKLDSNGNFTWAIQTAGKRMSYSNSFIYSMVLDKTDNVYTTGYFSDTVDFDPGLAINNMVTTNAASFISKFDSSGKLVWVRKLGGSGGTALGNSICIDSLKNVYTTGVFLDTIDFDPGGGIDNLSSSGNYDLYISGLNASGDFEWAKRIGGTGDDEATALTINSSGDLLLTGFFSNTVDFNPGAGISNLTATTTAYPDIFIEKLHSSLSVKQTNRVAPVIQCYPNPANGKIIISAQSVIGQIELIDIIGRTILAVNLNSRKSEIDISHLPNGIYIVKADGLYIQKLVKE
jgi:hypothetical protein